MNKNLEEYLPDGNKAQYRFMKYRIHKLQLDQLQLHNFLIG